jgi:hypothetical protein
MPLFFDSTPLTDETVRALMADYRAEVEEMLVRIRSPPGRVVNPLGLRTAEELAFDLRELLVRGDAAGCPPELRRAIVNVAYDSVQAVLTLFKTSVDMPRVPRSGAKGSNPKTRP